MASMFSLHGQTALITGGTRGIGQAMACALAEAGADIIFIQRSAEDTSTKAAVERLNRKATIYTADLASSESLAETIATILTQTSRIDILVNCAGVQRRHPCHQFPSDEWDEVIQVNLTAVLMLCRDVGAHMLHQKPNLSGKRGTIINVASLLSFQGGINIPAYAASKGGIAQLTKAFSNEFAGQGVSVNAIAPGYVETDMNAALRKDEGRAKSILDRIPAGRWGTPDDFKGPIVFLASAASGYVSGEILVVDGGWMGR